MLSRQCRSRISIHALLAESDAPNKNDGGPGGQFLSTLSLRRATTSMPPTFILSAFLSTLSLRRATPKGHTHYMGVYISIHALLAESDRISKAHGRTPAISIHALLAESDSYSQHVTWPSGYFYPRSPCGERRQHRSQGGIHHGISIHALLAESDHYFCGAAL